MTYGGRKRRTTHESDPGASLWVYGRKGEPCRRCGERDSQAHPGTGCARDLLVPALPADAGWPDVGTVDESGFSR